MEQENITLKDVRKSIKNKLGGTCFVPRDMEYRIRQASKHKSFRPELIKKIRTQEPEMVLSEATKEARELYNLARQVSEDRHRVKMYTRLKISRKGILYGKISPEHNVEFDCIDFFVDRFPTFLILLGSKKGVFYGSRKQGKGFLKTTLGTSLERFEKNMKEDEILSELDDPEEELWKEFYSAQYVPGRKNWKLFYQNMPKKSQEAYDMEMEKNIFKGNRSLLEF